MRAVCQGRVVDVTATALRSPPRTGTSHGGAPRHAPISRLNDDLTVRASAAGWALRIGLEHPQMEPEFEAVYYSGPAPTSLRALTVMGLVFDRVIFPGVYVPQTGVDIEGASRELDNLRRKYREGLKAKSPDDFHLLNLMSFAVNVEYLKDFLVFTGKPGRLGVDNPEVRRLTHELELAIYGPPPKNFFPTVSLGFARGLPGDADAGINSPSWISYPANALLHAGRTGTILINDNPNLPVLAVPAPVKANAKMLATIMAIESVNVVLPDVGVKTLAELAEFRLETKELVKPFRRAMVGLSRDLNAAILSDATLDDVWREAHFIVETTVQPALMELRADLDRAPRPWHRRAVDAAKGLPELAGAFLTLPTHLAVAKALASAMMVLADLRDDQLQKEGLAKRGGFHYLLKVQDLRK